MINRGVAVFTSVFYLTQTTSIPLRDHHTDPRAAAAHPVCCGATLVLEWVGRPARCVLPVISQSLSTESRPLKKRRGERVMSEEEAEQMAEEEEETKPMAVDEVSTSKPPGLPPQPFGL